MPGRDDRPLSELSADELDELRAKDGEKNRRQQEAIAGFRDRLVEEKENVDEDVLALRRFTRTREILAWLTKQSHYMEPPAFLLFQDGSGTLFVGEKTLSTWPELTKDIARLVGSSRWGTQRRENGTVDITLHFCHLELEEPVPKESG